MQEKKKLARRIADLRAKQRYCQKHWYQLEKSLKNKKKKYFEKWEELEMIIQKLKKEKDDIR